MKTLFVFLALSLAAFGQNPIAPANWQTLVASRDVKGMVLDGCNAYTGLNNASTACADNVAALNAVLNCNITLVLDIGTGISGPLMGPKNCSFAITGPGTLNVGVFALPAFSTNGGGPLISNGWDPYSIGVPYPTAGTPDTQLGSVTVSGITINGNARNQNATLSSHLVCALDGANPCIGIWLYALQSAIVEHNTVLPMGGWTSGSFDGSFETLFSNIGTIQVNHNTVTGLSTPTSDTLHFSGPIGSINADGNDLYNAGDDAICLCSPEEKGGNIGAATFTNTRANGTSQLFRMFDISSGGSYTVGPVVFTNFSVILTNSELGPVFDEYGNSTGTSLKDLESLTIAHGRVSGANNGMTNIQGSWADFTCDDVILSGANSSGAPFIKTTGSLTNLSTSGCGWELTQANHLAATYLQDVGTIGRLHIDNPICLNELGATGEPYSCAALIDTTAGGGGTAGIVEVLDTTNAGGYFTSLFVSGSLAHITTVAGDLTGFPLTVSTLPAAPALGTKAIVTDGSSPSPYTNITGGGSTVTPVIWNGTHWVAQ